MSIVLLSAPSTGTTLRASSVLQKNTKLYGPMNALDVTNGSSSWNSEGNNCDSGVYLMLQFGRPVHPTKIVWQFQAGFSAESCQVIAVVPAAAEATTTGHDDSTITEHLELDDVHELQSCDLKAFAQQQQPVQALKLVLDDCTDFYGRVILYRLEVWGKEEAPRAVISG